MASQPINSNHIPAYRWSEKKKKLLQQLQNLIRHQIKTYVSVNTDRGYHYYFFPNPFKSHEHRLVSDCGEIFGILSPYFLHLACSRKRQSL